MTTEQKYQAVAQAIRQALPRMVEVGEGCFIKHKKYNWKRKIIHINKEKFYMIEIDGFHPIDILSYKIKEFDKDKWEIIDKEPMINDVLEWLNMFDKTIYILSETCLSKVFYDVDALMDENAENNCFIKDVVDIDLSKPYLKDQSEELINFLYELINK